MTGVLVVVPARDEADGIAATLRAVLASVDEARGRGLVQTWALEVAAHRCLDDTVAVAGDALRGRPQARVRRDDDSFSVGEVRDRATRLGLDRLGGDPADTWLLSTDADTHVGVGWVGDILSEADRADAVGVVGLAPLDAWYGGAEGAAAYARVLAAKMRTGPLHQHDHVYGANLAVRVDAYLAVGGFSRVGVGEDQALVDALAAGGHRLLRTTTISVTTSGRLRGRATGGLADHLARLDAVPRSGEPVRP